MICKQSLNTYRGAQAAAALDGLALMADRSSGNCVSCHEIPALQQGTPRDGRLTLQGNLGPSLQGVGARYPKEQLRQWVTDARVLRPDTLMPPYGSTAGLNLPARESSLLNPTQIEAVVEVLASFTSPAATPAREPSGATPTGLAQLQAAPDMSPVRLWIEEGRLQWAQQCTTCHALESVLRAVPHFPRLERNQQLRNLEDQIQLCQQRSGVPVAALASSSSREATSTLELSAFLIDAAREEPIAMTAPSSPQDQTAWRQHWLEGERLFKTRAGMMNLSCQHCHDQKVGATMRAQRVSAGHPTGFPAYRISWQGLGSMERRLRACYSGVQAQVPAPGDVRLRQLELYLKVRAQGLPLGGPSVRY
mgnify:FL=1